MPSFLRRVPILVAAVGALLLFTATPAQAAFKLRISDGTTTITITDNDLNDLSGTTGAIAHTGSLGVFTFTLSSALSQPLPPNNQYLASMQLTVTFSSTGAGTLTVTMTDTNFNLSATPYRLDSQLGASGSGGFNAGTDATYKSVFDPNNSGLNEFSSGGAGTTVVGPHLANNPVGSFASAIINPTGNPFSLTGQTVINVTGASSGSIDATTQVIVPAPAGIALAFGGLSCLGLGALVRRRKAMVV